MDSALRPIVASQAEAPSDGEVMTFTALGVPYDFALGAFVDTGKNCHILLLLRDVGGYVFILFICLYVC